MYLDILDWSIIIIRPDRFQPLDSLHSTRDPSEYRMFAI
jgi:hypothetical protein